MSKKDEGVNVMCDLETLGLRPGCIILSLAAVPFLCDEKIPPFYMKINKSNYPTSLFHSDPMTEGWWTLQSEAARTEAFSGTAHPSEVLHHFNHWCSQLPGKVILWGNGSDFDNVILQEAYRLLGLHAPWKYFDNRCYRTLKNLFPQIKFTKTLFAHNALEDAKAQAVHAEEIFRNQLS